ncbi:hypothetical protein [Mariniradius sediminis]|uniref:Uncharacterized protein n=1 Tax=Mariniradius sediminis TaxID=2909237 RepID=A0ABS9BUP1_9BACT|nr:hypothetical protein [Mariniradius sediminis]MCF1751766.1 hypothetical protein [Mariniradius sediminis]
MKRRISIFFLTLSVALMMGHNLIPHCHHGHSGDEHKATPENPNDQLHSHEGLLGNIFSLVAHNHAGMVYFDHLEVDVLVKKKSEKKASVAFFHQTLFYDFVALQSQDWALPPPDFHFSNQSDIRGLRAPPALG